MVSRWARYSNVYVLVQRKSSYENNYQQYKILSEAGYIKGFYLSLCQNNTTICEVQWLDWVLNIASPLFALCNQLAFSDDVVLGSKNKCLNKKNYCVGHHPSTGFCFTWPWYVLGIITFVGAVMSLFTLIFSAIYEHNRSLWYLDDTFGLICSVFMIVYGIR